MNATPSSPSTGWLNKVPEATLAFWIIKILATTVGETGADSLAVHAGWGQGMTSAVMAALLTAALCLQLRARRYTPWAYWLTVVLVSVVGTQLTDLLTDGLGISLYASSSMFALTLAAIFAVWFRSEGTLSIRAINTRRRELFYWSAILCTFALGTAAGDLATEALGLGFAWGALAFGALIAASCAAWRLGRSAVLTFWLAYILTRPFGAALGDLLTQAVADGGLGLGTLWTSALFLTVIMMLVAREQFRRGAQAGEALHRDAGLRSSQGEALAKVPELTLGFWIIKIAATTLGETGGDAVSMSMHLGYLIGTAIFSAVFLAAVVAQVRAKGFHPLLYWTTIIATTTVGTTLADFADRSLGIGYAGGSSLLLALLLLSLLAWHRTLGSVSVNTVSSSKAEAFYWGTIMLSQTLGTALGDWAADSAGLGYGGAAVVFAALLGLVVLAYYRSGLSRTLLFWAAFILTRPLGAVVGDFLDKPLSAGGLALSRFAASAVLLAFILGSIAIVRQRAARTAH